METRIIVNTNHDARIHRLSSFPEIEPFRPRAGKIPGKETVGFRIASCAKLRRWTGQVTQKKGGIMEKFVIGTLPVTEAFLKEKRPIEERGEIALVVDGQTFSHLTYFSLEKGKGLYREGHYDKKQKNISM
jgi:hypothetical protein